MSMGYTFVLADDGKFYEDPVFRGEDYFLCFDEDEPPELVIMKLKRTRNQLLLRAKEILEELGIEYSNLKETGMPGYESERCFSKNKTKPAQAFFLDIHAPIPAKKITEYEFICEEKNGRRPEGTYLTFKRV